MAADTIPPVTRGPQLYAFKPPAQPYSSYSGNPFTRDQLEAFFRNIPSDELRNRLIDGVLNGSFDQAISGFFLQAGPWVGFNTTPPMPVPDLIVNLPAPAKGQIATGTTPKLGGGGGGGGPGQIRKQLL